MLVSVLIVGWLAWRTDWGKFAQALAGVQMSWLGMALALYLVIQATSALRWQLLARPLGFERSFGEFARFYLVGMFFNLFLPTSVGGDVVRAWYLHRPGSSRMAAFLSVFVDRASGLLVLLLIGLVGMLTSPVVLPDHLRYGVYLLGGSAAAGIAGLGLCGLLGQRMGRIQRMVLGMRVFLSCPGLVVAATGLSVVVQGANVALLWLVGKALGLDVPFAYYVVMVPMVSLLTMLPISVNGIGIREGATILFLAAAGISEAQAISLSVLWFMVFTMASLLGGIVYLLGDVARPEGGFNDAVISDHSDQGRTGQSRAAA